MDNAKVAHNFAHKTGNVRNGNNLFYEMYSENEQTVSTIYSYGYHFPIAHIDAKDTVLFTNQSYSNSTAKHINHVRNALYQPNIIYVDNPKSVFSENDINRNYSQYDRELRELKNKHERARKYSYTDNIKECIDNAIRYIEYLKTRNKNHKFNENRYPYLYTAINKGFSGLFDSAELQKINERKKAYLSELRKKEAEKLKADIALFRAFKSHGINGTKYTYLRYDKTSNVINTSKGIDLTIHEAKALWKFIKHANKGIEVNPRSTYAGFKIDSITKDYIKAGCHLVSYNECKLIAKELSL